MNPPAPHTSARFMSRPSCRSSHLVNWEVPRDVFGEGDLKWTASLHGARAAGNYRSGGQWGAERQPGAPIGLRRLPLTTAHAHAAPQLAVLLVADSPRSNR